MQATKSRSHPRPVAVPYQQRMSYTIERSAALLDISRTMVYEELKAGRLASFLVGRRRLIPHEALEKYIAERRAEAV